MIPCHGWWVVTGDEGNQVVMFDGGCDTFLLAQRPFDVFPTIPAGHGREATVFQFCKTNRLDYDDFVVVVAALCLLYHEFPGKMVSVASDGDELMWMTGRTLAGVILGKSVPLPPMSSED